MGRADRDDQGGPPRRPGRRVRDPGGLGGDPKAAAGRPASPDGDPGHREGRHRTDQPCAGADPTEAPAPGAPGCDVRTGGRPAPAGAGRAAGALPGPGGASGRAARAAGGDGGRPGGRRQGEGASAGPDRRCLLPERDDAGRQGGALRGEGLGVRRRRSPRGEHGGRCVPGHLRHGHDGDDHERAGDAARGAGRLLPARVREAGGVREHGAHRREQPGRRAVDRVRRLRRRFLHLLRRRLHRPAVLSRRRSPRRRSARAESSGRP